MGEPCEERAEPRLTLLIRAAKLIAPTGEFICVIRDVSENGISLRAFHALPQTAPLELELRTGDRHRIEPVWDRGSRAGYKFVEPVDLERLVSEACDFPKRQLRMALALPIEIIVGGRRVAAETINLSQQGAQISCAELLAIGQPLRICSKHLPEVCARVRWRNGTKYGLVLDDTFSLRQLALILAQTRCPELLLQTPCPAAQRR